MTNQETDDLRYRVQLMVHGRDSHGGMIEPFQHKFNGCVHCNRLMDFVLAEIRIHTCTSKDC